MAQAVAWTEQARRPGSPEARRDGWGIYLLLVVILAPVLVPSGPAQSAFLDVVNFVALPIFAATMLVRRKPVVVPFLLPVFLIALASLIATMNATSARDAALTMIQDTYLFLWFVVLVNLLRDRRDLTGFRVAWMWVANLIALYGLVMVLAQEGASPGALFGARGARAMATFQNPNMFADYLVMSFFIVLSLGEEAGRIVRLLSAGLILAALVATKSNGAFIALGAGLVAWGLARAWTLRLPAIGLLAAALLGGSVLFAGVWLVRGLGVGEAGIESLRAGSVLGRASHSAEGRFRIWKALLRSYAEKPLGLGPGNSRSIEVSVEERMRRESFMSKEAHNDYLAYLVERGPLALIGMLAIKWQAFGKITGWWRQRARRGRGSGAALAAAAIAALVATSVHSFTLETLHFRHLWVFLALVCAMDGMVFQARRAARGLETGASGPEVRPAVAEAVA